MVTCSRVSRLRASDVVSRSIAACTIRLSPSTRTRRWFGKFALLALGVLYLVYSAIYFRTLLDDPFSIIAMMLLLLHLAIGVLILAGFRRMARRDTWAEYRLYDD